MERFLPLCANIKMRGRKITAYITTRSTNIHVVRSRENRTNNWQFLNRLGEHLDTCNQSDSRNQFKQEKVTWLLLLSLRQSLSECPAVSTSHTRSESLLYQSGPFNKHSMILHCELKTVVAYMQRKASFTILFMMYIWSCILWGLVLGATTEPARWRYPMALPSRKFNLKLLQACL